MGGAYSDVEACFGEVLESYVLWSERLRFSREIT